MIEITFIRHGESTSNVAGRWQGQGDAPLSEGGVEQAKALGDRLFAEPFDVVISSDLTRAASTAAHLGRPVRTDAAWRELDVGAWEGLLRHEVAQRFPDEVAALRAGEHIRVGGGESWLDLWERIDGALERLVEDLTDGSRAVVVTHGGVIHGIVAGALGLRERHPRPVGRVTNTATTTLRIDRGRRELRAFNDATHLGPRGAWVKDRLAAGAGVATVIHEATEGPDLAAWYGRLDHLYGGPGSDVGELARHLDAGVEGPLERPLQRSLTSALARHPGARVGVASSHEGLAEVAEGIVGPGNASRLEPVGAARVSHIVMTEHGPHLADYNVGPKATSSGRTRSTRGARGR